MCSEALYSLMFATRVFARGMILVLRTAVAAGHGQRLVCMGLGQSELKPSRIEPIMTPSKQYCCTCGCDSFW